MWVFTPQNTPTHGATLPPHTQTQTQPKPQPFLRWRPTPNAASFGPGFIPIAPQPPLAQVHLDIWAWGCPKSRGGGSGTGQSRFGLRSALIYVYGHVAIARSPWHISPLVYSAWATFEFLIKVILCLPSSTNAKITFLVVPPTKSLRFLATFPPPPAQSGFWPTRRVRDKCKPTFGLSLMLMRVPVCVGVRVRLRLWKMAILFELLIRPTLWEGRQPNNSSQLYAKTSH